jgi:acyl transferase domain-containing protein/NAD(P)-dependent dehydrogenase (short-subunit alcohol dehydrogenase family)/NAD(P)H-dependent flavin oxidoreductase YrpB (nitropropane dioxygenase family)
VLDAQLTLTRESTIPSVVKRAIARMDGSETICLGEDLGEAYRIYAGPGSRSPEALRQVAKSLTQAEDRPRAERLAAWRLAVLERVGWEAPECAAWLIGQDAAFAAPLAARFQTVGGVIEGMREAVGTHIRAAQASRPLDEGAPVARAHGTRFPIVQGPMTRVSDTPAFAASVAEGGALPFLALALLRGPQVRTLLEETRQRLGNRPWGVGILGFVPPELRQEQYQVIRAVRPPFALIAGGRPDQALVLEQDGIATYLHVPSPGLLKLFLEQGARRFIFEGRECGGHVGPRSSFVLWNMMIDLLLDALPGGETAEACHVLFAGGIHDARSAAMVATLAAPLAERGVKVGVLIGTAYLFTREVVETGAIVKTFQEEAVRCSRTTLLETGPGHSTRCIVTPFTETFERERRRLWAEGKSPEEIRDALEELNLGRLRIASKGIARNPRTGEPDAADFSTFSEEEQRLQGMYMIGQVATLRDRTCTIPELHHDLCANGSQLVEGIETEPTESALVKSARPCDIAIIGMACIMPKAPNLSVYWANILNKVNAITEIPIDRFDWPQYYDRDPRARDKICSKWGGFIDPIPFDPVRYGIPPMSLKSIEPLQLLILETVRTALEDAGYASREFARAQTGVIIGVGGGVADLGQQYCIRSGLPMFTSELPPDVWGQLPEWTEDSFAGILLNVAAGRVANRFDLGGVNYTVDAACASSLAALYAGVRELEGGTADIMIVGGADTAQNPFGYLCFSTTGALSLRGQCRTFDESADGIVISEGVAVVVLKRLADAERDGDRIYAVIKSVAGSSDGRGRSMTAPKPEGQILALQRAYAMAGFSPATVGLVEAHGTGTVVGDQAEIDALTRVFGPAKRTRQWCAVGSVKSMIGHTKGASGLAGLIKIVKAVYHKVLPPTIGVDRPNSRAQFAEGPFYVNSEARPWLQDCEGQPRRAGVSSFGFGGTNFHAVIEEYLDVVPSIAESVALPVWPAELFLFAGQTRDGVVAAVDAFAGRLSGKVSLPLRGLAAAAWQAARDAGRALDGRGLLLAIIATSVQDLQQKLVSTRSRLVDGAGLIEDPHGVYFSESPLLREGKVAFLFPGQGSQYPGMLREIALHFDEVRGCIEAASRRLARRLPEPLSVYVFPPPHFSPEERRDREEALKQTNVAQPAVGAVALGMFRLLTALGLTPEAVAGHSYGEYVALCSAGAMSDESLYDLSEARGQVIVESCGLELGTMVAVQAERDAVAKLCEGVEGVWIANVNAPRQTTISGTQTGVEAASQRLQAAGLQTCPVPVACAFHSPLLAQASKKFSAHLAQVAFATPCVPVFSNTLAAPYPKDPASFGAILCDHMVRPVRFVEELDAMYAMGCRIFVEVGPRDVLTALAQQTLHGRRFLAVPTDVPGRSGVLQLLHVVGQLVANGAAISLDRLFAGRLADIGVQSEGPHTSTTWLVSGGEARPLDEKLVQTKVKLLQSERPAHYASNGTSGPLAASGTVSEPIGVQPHVADPPLPSTPDDSPQIERGSQDAIMLHFQRVMARFLDTQRNVMLAYLGARAETGSGVQSNGDTFGAVTIPTAKESHPELIATGFVEEPETRLAAMSVPISAAGLKPAVDQGWLCQEFLRVVSDRTGYPVEMLDLDVNMEADLGIDSIKRVEILGVLQQALPAKAAELVRESLEVLTRTKTLRGILDAVAPFLKELAFPPVAREATVPAQPPTAMPVAPPTVGTTVPRFVLEPVDLPAGGRAVSRIPDGLVLITEDARGVAPLLAAEISRRNGRVALVRAGEDFEEMEPGRYRAALHDPDCASRLVAHIRQVHGPIGGILHLAPLADAPAFAEMDLAGWRARLAHDVKSLFYLARAAGADLQAERAAVVLAVTGLGGQFGCDGLRPNQFPGHGGVAGLVKTLAVEWPMTLCRVVDVDSTEASVILSARVLGELSLEDGEVEVGWSDARRVGLRLRPAQIDGRLCREATLNRESVVLVTGGARGITGEVAEELARQYRPTLILVGRQPIPVGLESSATAGLDAPREIKAALIAHLRQNGQPPSTIEVEAAYKQVLRDREVRRRIAVMKAAGATVVYRDVNVRNAAAFGAFIEDLYKTYGRIDGVIHGAGVIEDKLLAEKSTESFNRVFDTKVESAFVLARSLRPDSLKFLVFFSSVAGRFGNRGQSDYVAANEVMNKLARHLDSTWPGRVVALNWGPWSGSGMVSEVVARQFAERGVELVSPEAGRHAFDAELRCGSKGEVEVVLGRGPWRTVEPPVTERGEEVPLIPRIVVSAGNVVECVRELDVRHDLYLMDHQIDGRPVLPAAMAVELMAEVAHKGWPEWEVAELRGFRLLKGIVLSNGVKPIRVAAKPRTRTPDEHGELEVDVEIGELRGHHPAYRGTVLLASRLPDPPRYEIPPNREIRDFPVSVAQAYRDFLFHGPRFQSITELLGVGSSGIIATVLVSQPSKCLADARGNRWVIDPIVLDAGPQLAILWARQTRDMTALPSRFVSLRRFADLNGRGSVRCYFVADSTAGDHMVRANVYFIDEEGFLILSLEGLECISSRALNRLAVRGER